MNVNVWDVTGPIGRLIRERVAVDDARLADPTSRSSWWASSPVDPARRADRLAPRLAWCDQRSGKEAPRSASGRGPKMRRSDASIARSLIDASRRRM